MLSVFAEDADIPVEVLLFLWQKAIVEKRSDEEMYEVESDEFIDTMLDQSLVIGQKAKKPDIHDSAHKFKEMKSCEEAYGDEYGDEGKIYCDGCRSKHILLFYHCLTCTSFDYCHSCYLLKAHQQQQTDEIFLVVHDLQLDYLRTLVNGSDTSNLGSGLACLQQDVLQAYWELIKCHPERGYIPVKRYVHFLY